MPSAGKKKVNLPLKLDKKGNKEKNGEPSGAALEEKMIEISGIN